MIKIKNYTRSQERNDRVDERHDESFYLENGANCECN